MELMSEKKFPVNASDYNLYEEIGEGVSATVHRALCVPLNEIVAIKVLDLEKCNNDLDGIRREVQTMSLIDHPNLLRAYCSFTTGHSLWVVMPYMAGGSCLHIMKSAFPEGFEEPVIATLLREVLRALVYLHAHGHIHRDVKAGNILFDTNGSIKLADFGVSACMFDTGDRQRSRNTFVGTPCWMAPEVMQQLHGYDFKADIWSFGITALELAHGHAPFSKYPPMKVLLMTLQNAPPGLDYERDKRFSKSFKEMVAACLVKDPKKRPSSEKLLKHSFFKNARSTDYLARTILDGLSPLGDRFRTLKAKEAALLLQNKSLYGDKDQLSQQEYIRGISAWNFNLEDLKNQAAMIQDFDGSSNSEDPNMIDGISDIPPLENSLASFPIKPLQALKGCFDVCEDDVPTGTQLSDSELQQNQMMTSSKIGKEEQDGEVIGQSSNSLARNKPFLSGLVLQDNNTNALSPKKIITDGDRDHMHSRYPAERSFSGPMPYRTKKEIISPTSVEEVSEGAVVQRKGRFKVTSADLNSKPSTPTTAHAGSSISSPTTAAIPSSSFLLSTLQFILQLNSTQREEVIKVIRYIEQTSGNSLEFAEAGSSEIPQISRATAQERELQSQVIQLQQSVGSVVEELQRQKMKNAQLEKKFNDLLVKKEEKSKEGR
jgi:serine/threonine-protein kinase OSR1/STK39